MCAHRGWPITEVINFYIKKNYYDLIKNLTFSFRTFYLDMYRLHSLNAPNFIILLFIFKYEQLVVSKSNVGSINGFGRKLNNKVIMCIL